MGGALTTAQFDLVPQVCMGVPGQGATTSRRRHCAVGGSGCGPVCSIQQALRLLFLLPYSWKPPVLRFNCDKIHIT